MPIEARRALWGRLATDLRPNRLGDGVTEVTLDTLEPALDAILAAAARGRWVVRIEHEARLPRRTSVELAAQLGQRPGQGFHRLVRRVRRPGDRRRSRASRRRRAGRAPRSPGTRRAGGRRSWSPTARGPAHRSHDQVDGRSTVAGQSSGNASLKDGVASASSRSPAKITSASGTRTTMSLSVWPRPR